MRSGWFLTAFNIRTRHALWAACIGLGVAGLISSPALSQEKDKAPLEANEAQKLVLLKDHLKKFSKPVTLRYHFVRKSTEDDGFSDTIDMKIYKIREDGAKDLSFEFFTGERRKPYPDLTNFRSNPLFMVSLMRDTWDMARDTGGHAQQANYYSKKINIAIRNNPKIEDVIIDSDKGPIKAKKIVVRPFVGDSNIARFKKYEHKIYEFVFSEEIPGELYMVHTSVPSAKTDMTNGGLLIEETTIFKAKIAAK